MLDEAKKQRALPEIIDDYELSSLAEITEKLVQLLGWSSIMKARINQEIAQRHSYEDSINKKEYAKIISLNFCNDKDEIILIIKHPKRIGLLEKTAAEVILDKPLLQALSPTDAWLVCYASATEYANREATLINSLNRHAKQEAITL